MNPCQNLLWDESRSMFVCVDNSATHLHITLAGAIVVGILFGLVVAILIKLMSHRRVTITELLEQQNLLLRQIRDALGHDCLRLTSIKIRFGGTMPEGPVTLNVGQSTTASVDGFDQFGNPWTGAIPTVTYSIDNSTIASSTPNPDNLTDVVVGLAAGTANLTATLTTAEGLSLSDTQSVTVNSVPPPVPVLSSIKLNFSTPQ